MYIIDMFIYFILWIVKLVYGSFNILKCTEIVPSTHSLEMPSVRTNVFSISSKSYKATFSTAICKKKKDYSLADGQRKRKDKLEIFISYFSKHMFAKISLPYYSYVGQVTTQAR